MPQPRSAAHRSYDGSGHASYRWFRLPWSPSRGLSLAEMMVDLNIVYITAVGPLLGLSLLNIPRSDKAANSAITAGCAIAMTCYLIRWVNIAALPEATALFFVLPISLLVALASRRTVGASSNALSQSPARQPPDHSPSALSGGSGGS